MPVFWVVFAHGIRDRVDHGLRLAIDEKMPAFEAGLLKVPMGFPAPCLQARRITGCGIVAAAKGMQRAAERRVRVGIS